MAEPIEPEFREVMTAIGRALDVAFNGPPSLRPGAPGRVGFALLTFKFGETEGGGVNYISNANREDMIAAMREWLGRAKGRVVEAPSTRQ